MELLQAFGIDYKILLAQLVNFAILFFVLYKVGYKPIFTFLEDRKRKIASGITMAEKAEAQLRAADAEKSAIIIDAKKEANTIITKAHELAEQGKEEKIKQAKDEIAAIIAKEREKIVAEKTQTLKEVKAEIADVMAVALEKITGERIDSEKDKAMIADMIRRT